MNVTSSSRPGSVLDDLNARGLVYDGTDAAALGARLTEGPITLYAGFDPTADSLHLGHLVPLLLLRRFQRHGHRPVALAGGATGMIGDPGGRSEERNLLDADRLAANVAAIKEQLRAFLDFDGPSAAVMVDNRDWTEPMGVLDFLRDVGKHVTVGTMLAKESVRSRIHSEHGISYTEFSYMLLQANDYFELHRTFGCELQVGGSDQWGNITAGIEMIRRRTGASVHGLTVPLVTRSDGQKFGKSVAGAVWLDPRRTLPYELHQYLLNIDDRDVRRLLLQLTLLPVDEVEEVVAVHRAAPERRVAQGALAGAVTELVHGPDETRRARLAAGVLFGEGSLDHESLEALRGIVPETIVPHEVLAGREAVVDLMVTAGVASSRGDARRTLAQGGVRFNGHRVAAADDPVNPVGGRYVLVQRGRKLRHLVVVSGEAPRPRSLENPDE
ncbi:MAG: tyrosine--tRNA ligase [Acidimicrobiales bacterium]